MKENHELRQGT